ncbi:MAG: HAD family hydrolase [Ktedonobacteraceae bacterium]
MIQALIFDFDGLIIDTEISAFQTWQEIYREYECDLPFSTWAECIGGSPQLFDPCEYLEAQIGRPILREEIRLRRRQQHMKIVETLPILPGIEEYILSAKRLGLKLGVASSSRHEWVDSHLIRLGLIQHFDAIKCYDDVKHTKPDPELYLSVLAELGLQGRQAIALEDSPNGVRAAQRAGIFCVAVPNPVTSQLPLEHADLQLTSLSELPLEGVIQEVESRVKS